jgi:hypothetical protein
MTTIGSGSRAKHIPARTRKPYPRPSASVRGGIARGKSVPEIIISTFGNFNGATAREMSASPIQSFEIHT